MSQTETQAVGTTEFLKGEAGVSIEVKKTPQKAKLRSDAVAPAKPDTSSTKRAADTKTEMVLKKLRGTKGASIDLLMQATGWQAHSVRGFMSGTVKKKLGLIVTSETGKDGIRRYRIDDAANAG